MTETPENREQSDRPERAEDWGGMQTGSDAGAPGDHLPDPPLSQDELRLLAELESDGGEPISAVEDSPDVVRAVEDDSPLPLEGGDPDDPDTPRFEAPPD